MIRVIKKSTPPEILQTKAEKLRIIEYKNALKTFEEKHKIIDVTIMP